MDRIVTSETHVELLLFWFTKSSVICCRDWKQFTDRGAARHCVHWRGLTLNKLECLKQAF